MLGFKDFVSAQITLAGVELVHRIRQGQFALRKLEVADGAGDLERGARRLRRKAFKIDLGLQNLNFAPEPVRPGCDRGRRGGEPGCARAARLFHRRLHF
jgi:hypothetical protein